MVAMGTLLGLSRQSGVGAISTIWAEDGSVFLQDAMGNPSPSLWLAPYAGYMHLAPRVAASVAAWLPIEWAPLLMTGGAALAVAALAALVYRIAAEHIPAAPERLALATSMVLLPVAGLEGANAFANLHWYLLFASAWLTVGVPQTNCAAAVAGFVLFVSAASSPFAALAAPILAWRALRKRRAVDIACLAAFAAGTALQAGVILSNLGSRPLDPLAADLTSLVRWYGFHVIQSAVLGVALRDAALALFGTGASALVALLLLAYVASSGVRGVSTRPFFPIVFAALHLAYFVIPVTLAGASTPRYAITPILLVYSILAWAVALDRANDRPTRGRVAVGLLAVLLLVDFSPPNQRSEGPTWRGEVEAARRACTSDSPNGGLMRIPPQNLPDGDPRSSDGYWTVRVPCGKLVPHP
jgi:hypothetical protein